MLDPNNWQWQIFTEDIDQAQQILSVVEQVVIFPQKFLVDDHVGVLVSHICNPDTPDLELQCSGARILQQIVPNGSFDSLVYSLTWAATIVTCPCCWLGLT